MTLTRACTPLIKFAEEKEAARSLFRARRTWPNILKANKGAIM